MGNQGEQELPWPLLLLQQGDAGVYVDQANSVPGKPHSVAAGSLRASNFDKA